MQTQQRRKEPLLLLHSPAIKLGLITGQVAVIMGIEQVAFLALLRALLGDVHHLDLNFVRRGGALGLGPAGPDSQKGPSLQAKPQRHRPEPHLDSQPPTSPAAAGPEHASATSDRAALLPGLRGTAIV